MIYFDHNATTPLHPSVRARMDALYEQGLPCNASSQHHAGQRARALLSEARAVVAQTYKVSPQEVIFTSGATEALHLLIMGCCRPEPGEVIASPADHKAVTEQVLALERLGYRIRWLHPNGDGLIRIEELSSALSPQTRLIALSWVHSETGVIQNVDAFGCLAARYGIPCILDAVAAAGREPLRLPAGITGLAISGHKIYGPAGTGLALVRRGAMLRPQILGGGQEGGRRAGTEPVIPLAGLAQAVRSSEERREPEELRLKRLRACWEQKVSTSFPEAVVMGRNVPRVANTSCIAFPGADGELLVIQMDRQGVCVSHGTACSAGAQEPSPTLRAMGLPREWVRGALRFSFGLLSQEEDLDRAFEALRTALAEQGIEAAEPASTSS